LATQPELDRLRVVLVSTRNPLNIGAAARAMSNFGFSHLRVVNPYELSFREARSAVGASALLASAEEFTNLADAVADCTLVVGTTAIGHRQLQHPVRTIIEGAPLIRSRLESSNVAILFGSEKVGLSNHDLGHCHWLMHIPTRDEHLSMNLGQAVAVCLHEIARDQNIALEQEKLVPATASEIERITSTLLQALDASGYVEPRGASATEDKIRRMVRRLNLDHDDAEVWLGMLRQMLWKLRNS
jgi:tRNA/rRNA methyltransferase